MNKLQVEDLKYPLIPGSTTWVPPNFNIEAETQHYVMFMSYVSPMFDLMEELLLHDLKIVQLESSQCQGQFHLICEKLSP